MYTHTHVPAGLSSGPSTPQTYHYIPFDIAVHIHRHINTVNVYIVSVTDALSEINYEPVSSQI